MTERVLGFAREPHPRLEKLRQFYFWVHLIADFFAGLSFLVGSIFFLYKDLLIPGTWLFIIGSALFAAKPTVRLIHEIHRSWTVTHLLGELESATEASAG